jgi:hypothetical protein
MTWNLLYSELSSEDGLNTGRIDEISEKFKNIFWIENDEDDPTEEDDEHYIGDLV